MSKSASHPTGMFVILILLVISLIVSYTALQKWPLQLRFTPATETKATPSVKVWAVKQTGLYYCPDSKLYQKVEPGMPGMLMTQEKALEDGYRPAGGETCH